MEFADIHWPYLVNNLLPASDAKSACVMTMHVIPSPHKKSSMTMLLFQLRTWDNQGHHCYNPIEFNYLSMFVQARTVPCALKGKIEKELD